MARYAVPDESDSESERDVRVRSKPRPALNIQLGCLFAAGFAVLLTLIKSFLGIPGSDLQLVLILFGGFLLRLYWPPYATTVFAESLRGIIAIYQMVNYSWNGKFNALRKRLAAEESQNARLSAELSRVDLEAARALRQRGELEQELATELRKSEKMRTDYDTQITSLEAEAGDFRVILKRAHKAEDRFAERRKEVLNLEAQLKSFEGDRLRLAQMDRLTEELKEARKDAADCRTRIAQLDLEVADDKTQRDALFVAISQHHCKPTPNGTEESRAVVSAETPSTTNPDPESTAIIENESAKVPEDEKNSFAGHSKGEFLIFININTPPTLSEPSHTLTNSTTEPTGSSIGKVSLPATITALNKPPSSTSDSPFPGETKAGEPKGGHRPTDPTISTTEPTGSSIGKLSLATIITLNTPPSSTSDSPFPGETKAGEQKGSQRPADPTISTTEPTGSSIGKISLATTTSPNTPTRFISHGPTDQTQPQGEVKKMVAAMELLTPNTQKSLKARLKKEGDQTGVKSEGEAGQNLPGKDIIPTAQSSSSSVDNVQKVTESPREAKTTSMPKTDAGKQTGDDASVLAKYAGKAELSVTQLKKHLTNIDSVYDVLLKLLRAIYYHDDEQDEEGNDVPEYLDDFICILADDPAWSHHADRETLRQKFLVRYDLDSDPDE
ncbi:MAG: hypothetical protein M1812_003885 [Candelaria pacifica]|nr:MAG: hypothetical protein M1812_003885 [Candelaria pacifica]